MEEDAGIPCLPFLDSIVASHYCQEEVGERNLCRRFPEEEELESHHLVVAAQNLHRPVEEVQSLQLHEGLAEAVPGIGCCWGEEVAGVENP